MNIDQIRNDIENYGNKLFLNSAGSSLMPKTVVRKVIAYLKEEELLGGYKVAALKAEEIESFYLEAAKIIGAESHNIAFTHDATDAYIKALSSIDFEEGDTIITTDDDYYSNHIQFISLQHRYGIKTYRIRNLENGDLDIEHFKLLVEKHDPKLVAVTHVPTNSGLVQDVETIGEICGQEEIIYLVDACQSVGQLMVDVNKVKCDFLTTTGRKFLRGPRGTGFLYVSDRVLEKGLAPLLIDGGGATWTDTNKFEMLESARRFQTWEAPYALIIGFTEALRYANDIGIERIQSYNEQLMTQLRENLAVIKDVQLFDRGSTKCNILTFRKEGHSLENIKQQLDSNNVFFSISTKENGFIDFSKKGIDGVIRLSPHYFNTFEEMNKVSEIIGDL